MELLYIWIEDYKNIRRQGFNFSAKHRFEFTDLQISKDENDKETVTGGTLKELPENPNYIDNFFGDNITNVTAIVGENGSGKSSVLEVIGHITKNLRFVETKQFVIITKESDKYYWAYSQSFAPINNTQLSLLYSDELLMQPHKKADLADYIIYYCPIFNAEHNIQDGKSYFDSFWENNLSVAYRLRNDEKKEKREDLIESYLQSEIKRQLSFIKDSSNLEKDLPMTLPKRIMFSINTLESTFENIAELKDLLSQKEGNSNLIGLIENHSSNENVKIENSFLIYDIGNQKALMEFIDYEPKLENSYIDYQWDIVLSSGEKALLSLFSNFYDFESQNPTRLPLKNYFTILIDEGELGMHPQWQKQYLQNILTVLPQIFKDKKLQFILTSHSPFLVSDLPKDHIIFLEKGEDGTCQVKNSLNEMKQTFGANIHTLLTDSFFMTGGLMGEFAKEKIQHLINYLNRENLDSCEIKTDEQAQKYLNIIGEPIIKNFLQKQLDSRRLQNIEKDHDARIKYLEGELERLRSKKE
ncbi:MAG: ATP-binding protein [Thermoflexibacter sp.]|jgi:predicted ATP-binding protein involved in virulence|nr:ATP-binding protein [Thermoflexibacter sp.]